MRETVRLGYRRERGTPLRRLYRLLSGPGCISVPELSFCPTSTFVHFGTIPFARCCYCRSVGVGGTASLQSTPMFREVEYLEARLSPRMPGFFYLVLCDLIPQGHSSPRFKAIRWPMPTIYISDSGDDKNDGLSLQTPIYSFKRAKELHGGRNDCSWHFGPRAWKRIKKELSEKDKRPM